MIRFFSVSFLFLLFLSCATNNSFKIDELNGTQDSDLDGISPVPSNTTPQPLINNMFKSFTDDPVFMSELKAIMTLDPYFWVFVDKYRQLDENYSPDDLIELENGVFLINKEKLFLRKEAAESLKAMASAARAEGVILLISSAYRSYSYQEQIYPQLVKEMGQEEADRVSARPGHSQHQLGLAIDFGSISNTFASSPQGLWVAANASRFGWSLSYPEDCENITGHSWESWHYRYVGIQIALFIDKYFNGIQHNALMFLNEYSKS